MSGSKKPYHHQHHPEADAPPPYYQPRAAPAMMYPSTQQGLPVAPGAQMMHGHVMPQGYVPPAGPSQPYAAPGQMYPTSPYPPHVVPVQPMYSTPYPQSGAPPPYGAPMMTAMPMVSHQEPQHLVVNAQFDAGARFNHISRPSIPPPPPGCPPNAAQLAMMSGQPTTVLGEQKKGGFISGSGFGGVKFW